MNVYTRYSFPPTMNISLIKDAIAKDHIICDIDPHIDASRFNGDENSVVIPSDIIKLVGEDDEMYARIVGGLIDIMLPIEAKYAIEEVDDVMIEIPYMSKITLSHAISEATKRALFEAPNEAAEYIKRISQVMKHVFMNVV